jgi:L-alanine-DL-glutamate epimerase-like enolase superfamily enzyme
MDLIDDINVSAYTIPTDHPEADGTLEWNSTTLILVELSGAGKKGIGYTYANVSSAYFIKEVLGDIVIGKDLMHIPSLVQSMMRSIRNNGSCGIAMMAVSAVDIALWDLKAKVLGLPLCMLLGKVKDEILIYGSGGFTSYTNQKLSEQLENWTERGIQYVKMKIGSNPEDDVERVRIARAAVGDKTGLFVDANGAYTVKQALEKANRFTEYNVVWYEEPVHSENLEGLQFIKKNAPAKMNITAGEYGYNLAYFQQMLRSDAVDILQADATRCGGITGFLKAGYLCEAFQLPFSSHCATAIHLAAGLALPCFYIAEYFHDHARIEEMLFDGAKKPENGTIKPDLTRPGHGLDFKYKDAEKYKAL